jgi:16S rRNA (guanine1207-N2)-methyltransferase
VLAARRLLVIGAPSPEGAFALDDATGGTAQFFFVDHAVYRGVAQRLGPRATASPWYADQASHDAAVLFLPKGKRRRDMWLSMAASSLTDDGRLILVGHKDEGVKSARAAMAERFAEVTDDRPGHHCRLLLAIGPQRNGGGSLDDWAAPWNLERPGGALPIVSLPGVFSDGRLDPGTALLLEHWQVRQNASVLDVGCGAGILGVTAALAGSAGAVWMVDADYLAVEAARRTAAAVGDGAEPRILPSDVYSAVERRFDVVVSNPPFHQGVRTEHGVAARIIEGAPSVLNAGGELWLVANTFLPYPELIRASFGSCATVAKNRQFAVYRAILRA